VLRRTRHLFVSRDGLRDAVTAVANATLAARDPAWWDPELSQIAVPSHGPPGPLTADCRLPQPACGGLG
jgi:hypothetical protein